MSPKRMPFSEHLIELRKRLILCLLAAVVGMIVAYIYYPDVFYPMIRAPLDALQGEASANPFVLKTPLLRSLAEYTAGGEVDTSSAPKLHYQSIMVPIIMRLKVSFVIGMILFLPVIAYEIWAFVAAGLRPHEKRLVFIYGPASFGLFVFGASLAYFFVLPAGIAVLIAQGQAIGLQDILTINEYAPFVMWFLFGFGLVFQLPLVVLLLVRLGIVRPKQLSHARRYAILIMFIVAAVMTPPDPFTQVAMALPMVGLYEVSILLARFAKRKRDRAVQEQGVGD